MPKSDVYNCDCITFMQRLKDNTFDLCIADPPYGIDINSSSRLVREKGREYKGWDKGIPDSIFFSEMMRVSKNQIIWGANHFISQMPFDSSSWVVWDKKQPENLSFAMCELAWTNINKTAKIFRYSPSSQSASEERIHPTQKPIALYEWLIKNYAIPGGVIFDPMMGSQSSRIAAYRLGFDFVGCELDEEYFYEGCNRFNRECKTIFRQGSRNATRST